MKATAEAARLTQAIRLPAANACSRRFDYDQAQLGTRSAIFAVGQHFVQGAPFAIPTAPGADLSDRLRARVPSEVATETLQCRRSYSQAVEPGIKLPLRNFEPVSAHQTLVGRFNTEKTDGSIPGRVRHFSLVSPATGRRFSNSQ
jgi:hypothetical protein